MLTDTAIRKAKADNKPQKLFDGGGLYLEVSPRGNKRWRLKYRYQGKEKLLSLGLYPANAIPKGNGYKLNPKYYLNTK